MKNKKFTLIELLIVVAIIAILASLLMPSLSRARESALFAVCKSNQNQHFKTVAVAVKMNNGRIPRINPNGQANPDGATDLEVYDWYGADRANFTMVNPLLDRYAGGTRRFLRCPAIKEGIKGSGIGSNGNFDQSFIGAFSNAFISTVSTQSWMGAAYGTAESVMTPFLVEEDPVKINGQNAEGGFAKNDLLAIEHFKTWRPRGSYTSLDGSNHSYDDPGANDLRNPYHMWTQLPNDRVDWLQYPVYDTASTQVWHLRNGILDQ